MHITFLIGNGFDRNLGLKTTYSDFVKVYKTLKSSSPHIETFRRHINENEEKWSAAEEALGQYTQYLEPGQGTIFSMCQSDFCVHLADYLKGQQERINYEKNQDKIKSAFGNLNNLVAPLSADERTKLNELYQNHRSENIFFDFINFNYTNTLDKCIEIIKPISGLLGTHKYSGSSLVHQIGKICHVHGTVQGEMVFGVNDESQISKLDVFNGNDLSKKFLIKKWTNETQGENTDEKAYDILRSSKIIYVYGMALGVTDKLWWNRICKWLGDDNTRHLILHQYGMPSKGVFQFTYQQHVEKGRKDFMQLGGISQDKWTLIGGRIHLTGENIFEGIKDIADSPENPDNAASPASTDLVVAR